MMEMVLDFEIQKIIEAVKQAGEILLSAHLHADEIYAKPGEANFVTAFDMRIQQFLIEKIVEICPDAAFFGEEATDKNRQQISETGYTFFIDPIDGTTNFLFDYRHSCISVGIAYCGKMVAGVVYNPYTGLLYHAVRQEGSFCNGKRLLMADKSISEGIVSFGCARYNENSTDLLFDVMKELFYRSLSIRNGGSSAIDLCRIAAGSNVLYLEMLLQPYDYAAASVIIKEAGGVIGQIDGSEITLDRGCSILAGTKSAVEECKEIIGGNLRCTKENQDCRI